MGLACLLLVLYQKTKKALEYDSNGVRNYFERIWNGLQSLGTEARKARNQRKN